MVWLVQRLRVNGLASSLGHLRLVPERACLRASSHLIHWHQSLGDAVASQPYGIEHSSFLASSLVPSTVNDSDSCWRLKRHGGCETRGQVLAPTP